MCMSVCVKIRDLTVCGESMRDFLSHSRWDEQVGGSPHRVVQKQMAFMLGRHGVFLELSEDVEEYEDLTEIMSNVQLNSNFLALAREVRVSALTCHYTS